MSKQFLEYLVNNSTGSFYRFVCDLKSAPRICWYPSAGQDFRPLMFLNESYTIINGIKDLPKAPDIFIYTDFNYILNNDVLGEISYPLIYIYAENESFCGEVLIPTKAKISHLIHVRYGCGFGGSFASGGWLLKVLKKLHCELFLTDNYHDLLSGDLKAIDVYPEFNNGTKAKLELVHITNEKMWSKHGDVSWYKVY